MTPWQLAKDSEHSQQVALFCFTAKAQLFGFKRAKTEIIYNQNNNFVGIKPLVPELAYYHAIPNGGNRGDTERSRAIEGGRMKAEGVKAGILDTFWPLRRQTYSGLYIEMKSAKGVVSPEQSAFAEYVESQGFKALLCRSWLEAADYLEWYYNLPKDDQ